MHEEKEKNGSAPPGAIRNPCSQALNTDSQPLEVQTRNSLLSQLTAHAVLPESLGHLEQNTTPEPLPSWGGRRTGAVSRAPGLPREEAAAGNLELKSEAARAALDDTGPREPCMSLPSPEATPL